MELSRLVFLLCILSVSGCITIVVPGDYGEYPHSDQADVGARALRHAQRTSQSILVQRKQENLDALIRVGVRIASDVQSWSLKPSAFGGPAAGETIADVLFSDIGYPNVIAGVYSTIDGQYTLESNEGVLKIVGLGNQFDNQIEIFVTDASPSGIEVQVIR